MMTGGGESSVCYIYQVSEKTKTEIWTYFRCLKNRVDNYTVSRTCRTSSHIWTLDQDQNQPAAVDPVVDPGQFVRHSVGDVGSDWRRQRQTGEFTWTQVIMRTQQVSSSPCGSPGIGSDHHSSIVLHRHDGGLKHTHNTLGSAPIIGQSWYRSPSPAESIIGRPSSPQGFKTEDVRLSDNGNTCLAACVPLW